jgi:hypothetical protein
MKILIYVLAAALQLSMGQLVQALTAEESLQVRVNEYTKAQEDLNKSIN